MTSRFSKSSLLLEQVNLPGIGLERNGLLGMPFWNAGWDGLIPFTSLVLWPSFSLVACAQLKAYFGDSFFAIAFLLNRYA